MIGRLRGRVLDKTPNRLTIDVHGVGYDVHVPLSTYYDVGEPGTELELRVHTHVREDALQLFGFLTSLEQDVFERLIATSGIGPKLAVAVLSGIIWGMVVFGESHSLWVWAALVLMFGGLAMVNATTRERAGRDDDGAPALREPTQRL